MSTPEPSKSLSYFERAKNAYQDKIKWLNSHKILSITTILIIALIIVLLVLNSKGTLGFQNGNFNVVSKIFRSDPRDTPEVEKYLSMISDINDAQMSNLIDTSANI